jgi:hypothetical protein
VGLTRALGWVGGRASRASGRDRPLDSAGGGGGGSGCVSGPAVAAQRHWALTAFGVALQAPSPAGDSAAAAHGQAV